MDAVHGTQQHPTVANSTSPGQGTATTKLKVLTFNVNGLRPCSAKFGGLTKLLNHLNADIICFQEHKLRKCDLDSDLGVAEGWDSYFAFTRGKTGYSGVATFCRKSVSVPCHAEEGLTGIINMQPAHRTQVLAEPLWSSTSLSLEQLLAIESEGRVLVTDHGAFVLINMYGVAITNEEKAEERRALKINMCKALEARVRALLAAGRRVLVVGDFNICPRPIDHRDPEPDEDWFSSSPDVSPTSWLWHLSWDGPLEGPIVDTFRIFHPTRTKAFTCWRQASRAREHNWGSRIDLILAAGPGLHAGKQAHDQVSSWVVDGDIWPDLQGSDHAPAWVQLAFSKPLSTQTPTPPPICCTRAILQPAKQSRLTGWLDAAKTVTESAFLTAAKTTSVTVSQAEAGVPEVAGKTSTEGVPYTAASGTNSLLLGVQGSGQLKQQPSVGVVVAECLQADTENGSSELQQQPLVNQRIQGPTVSVSAQLAVPSSMGVSTGSHAAAGMISSTIVIKAGSTTSSSTTVSKASKGAAGLKRSTDGGVKKASIQPKLSAFLKPLSQIQGNTKGSAGVTSASQPQVSQQRDSRQQCVLHPTASWPAMQHADTTGHLGARLAHPAGIQHQPVSQVHNHPPSQTQGHVQDHLPSQAQSQIPSQLEGQVQSQAQSQVVSQGVPLASTSGISSGPPHIVLRPPDTAGTQCVTGSAGATVTPDAIAVAPNQSEPPGLSRGPGSSTAAAAEVAVAPGLSQRHGSSTYTTALNTAMNQAPAQIDGAVLQPPVSCSQQGMCPGGNSHEQASAKLNEPALPATAGVSQQEAHLARNSQEEAEIEKDRKFAMALAGSQEGPSTGRSSGPLSQSAQAWKALFVPTQPPPCQHKEPSVLRTVKKGGPNDGRTFYVCARAEGPPPEGRCDFFQWADKRISSGGGRGRGRGGSGMGARAATGLFRAGSGTGGLPSQQPASKKAKH